MLSSLVASMQAVLGPPNTGTSRTAALRALLVAAAAILMSSRMRKHARASAYALPTMMVRLTLASWETIFRRSLMMAQGTCTPAEYQRMASEKLAAMQSSMMALARGRSHAAMLAPFVSRTRANVKRLRRNA
jgi:hypothetical protein